MEKILNFFNPTSNLNYIGGFFIILLTSIFWMDKGIATIVFCFVLGSMMIIFGLIEGMIRINKLNKKEVRNSSQP